tara:strand:- start:826 stop:1185 length:360 start_codon:yes stop_codon:yes gene_type:complete
MFKISEKDYTLVENPNHPLHGVKLLRGEWKDVIIIYGTVSVKESEELDIATLSFTFQVQDPADFTIDELENDEAFKNYLGAVLQFIITDSLDADNGNVARIGIGHNESNTDSDTESPPE